MTIAHRRAADREREAAAILRSKRVHRPIGERAPDVVPLRLPSGDVLVPEVKSREHLPLWLLRAVDQARSYADGCVPLVVISQLHGQAFALLPLRDLARLLGRQPPRAGQQLVLAPQGDEVEGFLYHSGAFRPAPRG